MNRRDTVLALIALGAAPAVSIAQQPKVWRIGYLNPLSPGLSNAPRAFTQGMRDLGYVEGKNLLIEWRFADGKYERLSGFAAELVRLKVRMPKIN